MAERKAKAKQPDRHLRKQVHWNPAEGLGEWVRAEAGRRGIGISHVLNEIVGAARQEAAGAPPPPQPRMGSPRLIRPAGAPGDGLAGLRSLAAHGAALREKRDTEGDGG